MSTVNYDLKNKGVRLIASSEAWIVSKTGKKRLNPKYKFLGKMEMSMPNMIVSATDKKKQIEFFQMKKAKNSKTLFGFYNIERLLCDYLKLRINTFLSVIQKMKQMVIIHMLFIKIHNLKNLEQFN